MRAALLRGVGFALAAVVLASGKATGQERPPSERQKYGKIRLGPLYLTPAVTLLAGVDNNVYNTPTGVADESVVLRPALTAVLPVTRHARLKGSGGFVPYY